jgi:hypothetical protein
MWSSCGRWLTGSREFRASFEAINVELDLDKWIQSTSVSSIPTAKIRQGHQDLRAAP